MFMHHTPSIHMLKVNTQNVAFGGGAFGVIKLGGQNPHK